MEIDNQIKAAAVACALKERLIKDEIKVLKLVLFFKKKILFGPNNS